ncbi:putative purinergic receptor [Tieghemostelium lacteum]|uniref:Putative purinergic receptor n=1 Tax=Tieghemostelium lacteum TaxID=361077 RepID=A0A152A2V1_TIELA|nr:putative purinergic receptor [Tieghemostelium lacteum]|eukprot:KYR00427.1 putative purinergic receptor [Tieghemostelium lacteum]
MKPQNVSTVSPPYCLPTLEYNGFPNKECEYWDEIMVQYPPSSESSLFVTTRVTSSEQATSNCSLKSPTCTWNTTAESSIYIGNLNNFTVLLDHTMSAPDFNVQFNAKQLPGMLLDSNGKEMRNLQPPNVIGQQDKDDILTIDTILQAAGIQTLDAPGESNSSRSLRDDGLLLFLFISYSNIYTYSTNKYRYTYEFALIPDSKYKVIEPIYTYDTSHRVIFNRHGIQIFIVQTGTLGRFDFQTMLITFVGGIGLVTVASVIVDIILLRILPKRQDYQKLKYQDSVDHDQNQQELDYEPID